MTQVDMKIEAKSDQLNADDLIAGPRTITITAVRGVDGDQPVAVSYEGDGGKPFKPCKTVRRVMVHCWGDLAAGYIGKRMTLYRDPEVAFGGIKVGGIRVSHMSHIDREMVVPLMVTRGKRAPYKVKPLQAEVRRAPGQAAGSSARRPDAAREAVQDEDLTNVYDGGGFGPAAEEDEGEGAFDAVAWATETNRKLDDFRTVEDLNAFTNDPDNIERFRTLEAEKPAMAKTLLAAINGRGKALASVGR